MLKFKNRDKDGKDFLVEIAISSVQGGVALEVSRKADDEKVEKWETCDILLTPMDVASFVNHAGNSHDLGCQEVGHGADGETLRINQRLWMASVRNDNGDVFVGGSTDVYILTGKLKIAAPSFVVTAMRLCMERMMESLLFPSTGAEEEEFG